MVRIYNPSDHLLHNYIFLGGDIKSQPQISSSVSAVTHKQVHVFNTSTSHVDLVVTINVDQSVVVNYLYIWFHNGELKDIAFVPQFNKQLQAKLTVTNPTIIDSGVYETVSILGTLACDYRSPYTSFIGSGTGVQQMQLLYSGILDKTLYFQHYRMFSLQKPHQQS